MGTSPLVLSGEEIEELLSGDKNNFGGDKSKKKGRKKKGEQTHSPFKKKSIFFYFPYWSQNYAHNKKPM